MPLDLISKISDVLLENGRGSSPKLEKPENIYMGKRASGSHTTVICRKISLKRCRGAILTTDFRSPHERKREMEIINKI